MTARRAPLWALALLPVAAALAAYGEVGSFGFVFDDQDAIAGNAALHDGDPWGAAFGEYGSLSNRPVPCALLALELRAGLSAGGMHLVSLGLHALAAALVFLCVHLALTAPRAPQLARPRAVALAVACLWAAHPLASDVVAYLTQTSMLLMALFALAACAAVLRAHRSLRPRAWQAVAVACTALALASKEESAALPILLVLLERAFVLPTWRATLARWRFHLALAGTWLVLAACVVVGPRNPTVGYATDPPATAWEWLLTQAPVIGHYALSVLWPADLRGVYDTEIVRSIAPALLPGALLVLALLGTLWAWRTRPPLAFAGAWFFLLLAPTSSVLPIISEPCADRRMYLPMLALLVPLACRASRLPAGAAAALLAAALCGEVLVARATARIYRDDQSLWAHAYATNALQNGSHMAGRILAGHARALHEQGRIAESHDMLERALRCESPTDETLLAAAAMRDEQGRGEEAERLLRQLLRQRPDWAEAMGNLAKVLIERATRPGSDPAAAQALLDEAEGLLQRAVARAPRSHVLANGMGVLLCTRGRSAEALPHLERALALAPDYLDARRNLGVALLDSGRSADAISAWTPLLQALPNDPSVRLQLAAGYRAAGDLERARALLEEALRIAPDWAPARAMLAQLRGTR
jgi:tetratricopeptide (TPR) repeat protein